MDEEWLEERIAIGIELGGLSEEDARKQAEEDYLKKSVDSEGATS